MVMMRRQGVALPKGQLSREIVREGILTIMDTRDNQLHRMVKVATLARPDDLKSVIYELIEPHIIWVNEDRFMLTGFEHEKVGDSFADYAQSWLCFNGLGKRLKNERDYYEQNEVRYGRRLSKV